MLRTLLDRVRSTPAKRLARSGSAPMLFEAMEARILYSADLSPTALVGDTGWTAPLERDVQQREVDPSPAIANTQDHESISRELVVVDTATPDYAKLIDDIVSQASATRRIDMLVLDPERDGVEQITSALANRHDLSAIHVISHGSEGTLELGSSVLDEQSLSRYADQIATWSNALTPDADLLLYGCDVAGSPQGRVLVDQLSRLTGADVAASVDATGYAAYGGNWNLEYSVGQIEADIAVSATARATWTGLLANSAPVLSGAGNVTAINEDPGANPGTLVSALLAGHVTDADAGAFSGIAVTAVDNTHGTWQYSTNGGGAWTAFGSPTTAAARLLAADANTYVRFVPAANWNGTVANGITFQAWDQTNGAAGGTADVNAPLTVRDQFTTASYANNDGSRDWKASWVDVDGNPSSGNIRVSGGQLLLSTSVLHSDSIYRSVDMAGASSATLSFSYDNNLNLLSSVSVQVSTGGAYTTIATFSTSSNTGSSTFNADISGYISSDTRIRFQANGVLFGGSLDVDDVQVAYVVHGGTTAFSAASASSSLTVNSVNDPPTGADRTVSIAEDTGYAFGLSDFAFTDANDTPPNSLLNVKITTLPAAGSLTLSGVAVTAGQLVSATDIANGNLRFTPAADANGTGYASFTFQVQDSGGTANGGINLDPTARTFTFNVTAVNDAPINHLPSARSVVSNGALVFSSLDGQITFSDVDAGGNQLELHIVVSHGTLTLGSLVGLTFSVGTGVTDTVMTFRGTLVDLNTAFEGSIFNPTPGYSGPAQIDFTTNDLGNSGSGGALTTSNTLPINVSFVNTAPTLTGANDLTPINEDSLASAATLVSQLIAGHVSDPDADALTGIAVTAVDNTNGTWEYSMTGASTWLAFGSPTGTSARLLAADANTYVRFVPHANWTGTVVNGLIFRAWDRTAGGPGAVGDTTFNGGTTPFSSTLASSGVLVASVGDAPAGADHTVTTAEDAAYAFTLADFGFTDPLDTPPNNFVAVQIATLPSAGSLTLSGAAVTAGQSISAANVSAGNLVYTPVAHANGANAASFTFQVQDDGIGIQLDPLARTMTIDVTAVNDPPVGTSNTVTAVEDGSYMFSVTDFGFTDPNDSPADALLAVRVATLPAAGALTLNGAALSAGQFVSAADIAAGHLVFTPAINANGSAYASFGFQVQDDGGGSNLDISVRTMTIDVTAGHDAPEGANATVTANEGTSLVLTIADFGFSDPNDSPPDNFLAVQIVSLTGAGTLALSGTAVTAGQLISAVDIAAGNLVFTPNGNSNGTAYASFGFRVQDDGGSSDFDTVTRTLTVDVTSTNDPPHGADNTVVTNEDAPYAFSVADFGFDDSGDSPANNLLAVKIASLPGTGVLSLSGVALSAGQFVSATDIAAGKLVFTPVANTNGTSYASFGFQVQDDGGGTDLDTIVRTMTIDVNAANDPPQGANNTVNTSEDTPYVFTAANFGFSDPNDSPANALLAVKITSLPSTGALTLNGVAISAGQFVRVTDINGGRLVFTPLANASGNSYASFGFQVQDDGGGADLDPVVRTMTIDVNAVNDPPQGASNAATTNEGTPYVFATGDFGFSDHNDSPANNLLAVKIVSLPGTGVLSLNGVALSAGQFVGATDIAAGKLVFTPVANTSGSSYATFGFQVQDDGGGADLDTMVRTMTLSVASTNDAPQGASNTVSTSEDTPYVFTAANFGFSDPNDSPANALLAVRITSLPSAGALTLNGVAISAGQFVGVTDINAGRLVFTPLANTAGASYASFGFQVQDDGGGADLDPVVRTVTIDVNVVNDPPVGASGTVVTAQDTAYVLRAADFRFSDPGDTPPNNLSAVEIATLPGAGALTLSGAAVSQGQFIGITDINAGRLVFTPAAGANGVAYATIGFKVQDDGAGSNLDTAVRTLTIDVTAPTPVEPASQNSGAEVVPAAAILTAPTPATFEPPAPAPSSAGGSSAEAAEATPQAHAPATHGEPANSLEDAAVNPTGGTAAVSAVPVTQRNAEPVQMNAARRLGSAVPVFTAPQILAVAEVEVGNTPAGNLGYLQSADYGSSQQALQSSVLASELDRMRDDVHHQDATEQVVVASAAATGVGLSVGYVLWLLRGGVLLSSVLSSLPAWRMVDPLPILGRLNEDDDEGGSDGEHDDSLESLVARNSVTTEPEDTARADADSRPKADRP